MKNIEPTPKQREILQSTAKFRVFATGRELGVGKTELCVFAALQATGDVLIFVPSAKAAEFVLERICARAPAAKLRRYRKSAVFPDGRTIYVCRYISKLSLVPFYGKLLTLVIFDDADRMRQDDLADTLKYLHYRLTYLHYRNYEVRCLLTCAYAPCVFPTTHSLKFFHAPESYSGHEITKTWIDELK